MTLKNHKLPKKCAFYVSCGEIVDDVTQKYKYIVGVQVAKCFGSVVQLQDTQKVDEIFYRAAIRLAILYNTKC